MDLRNSAMVVGLYLAGVVIVVVVCLGYYTHERTESHPSHFPDLKDRGVSPQANSHSGHHVSSPYYRAALAKEKQILRQQQWSMAESRDLLEKNTLALEQKTAECQTLKAELDQSFTLILSLLADESSDAIATRGSTKQAKSKLEAELARLIESLEQSEVLGVEQERQLTNLRADLQRSNAELATIKEHSELEAAALLSETKAFETVVTEIVARCGMAAVPVLVDRLSDERVEIRRWAVKALGAIGPEAQEAAHAVRRLLSDPDSTVRDEARRVLAILGGTGDE